MVTVNQVPVKLFASPHNEVHSFVQSGTTAVVSDQVVTAIGKFLSVLSVI
jgi:hypothetical protein